jgi:hypothetical protein
MRTFVILFIVVVAVMMVLSFIRFARMFSRTARYTDRFFDHAERELDRRASAGERVVCEYCGQKVPSSDKCSNCGAPLS